MFLVITCVALLIVLRYRGRLGPLVWDGSPALAATGPTPALTSSPDEPERLLAARLADGRISSDEYLEKLSLLQSA